MEKSRGGTRPTGGSDARKGWKREREMLGEMGKRSRLERLFVYRALESLSDGMRK
jgi:hypothetical protein